MLTPLIHVDVNAASEPVTADDRAIVRALSRSASACVITLACPTSAGGAPIVGVAGITIAAESYIRAVLAWASPSSKNPQAPALAFCDAHPSVWPAATNASSALIAVEIARGC